MPGIQSGGDVARALGDNVTVGSADGCCVKTDVGRGDGRSVA